MSPKKEKKKYTLTLEVTVDPEKNGVISGVRHIDT